MTDSFLSPSKGRSALSWLDRHGEEFLILTLLWVVIVIVTVEVFRRYVLSSSGEYSDEMSRLALIWLVYLGIPYAIRNRRHIVCEVIPANIHPMLEHALSLFSDLMFLIFAVLMVWYGWSVLELNIAMDKRTDSMGLPAVVVSAAPFVGCFLASIRLLQNLVATINGIRSGTATRSEIEEYFWDQKE